MYLFVFGWDTPRIDISSCLLLDWTAHESITFVKRRTSLTPRVFQTEQTERLKRNQEIMRKVLRRHKWVPRVSYGDIEPITWTSPFKVTRHGNLSISQRPRIKTLNYWSCYPSKTETYFVRKKTKEIAGICWYLASGDCWLMNVLFLSIT